MLVFFSLPNVEYNKLSSTVLIHETLKKQILKCFSFFFFFMLLVVSLFFSFTLPRFHLFFVELKFKFDYKEDF